MAWGLESQSDSSIDRRAFAVSWFSNRERWEKAFAFLRENESGHAGDQRYDIDGDNLYATVSEYMTKNEEDGLYEAHRKYIDIQYVGRRKGTDRDCSA